MVGTGVCLAFLNNLGQLVIALGGEPNGQVVFVSLFSVANAGGRLLFGYLPEHYLHAAGTPRTLWLAGVALTMAATAWGLAHASLAQCYVCSILMGAVFGAHWSLLPAITSDAFGLKHFAANYAALQVREGVWRGGGAGPAGRGGVCGAHLPPPGATLGKCPREARHAAGRARRATAAACVPTHPIPTCLPACLPACRLRQRRAATCWPPSCQAGCTTKLLASTETPTPVSAAIALALRSGYWPGYRRCLPCCVARPCTGRAPCTRPFTSTCTPRRKRSSTYPPETPSHERGAGGAGTTGAGA